MCGGWVGVVFDDWEGTWGVLWEPNIGLFFVCFDPKCHLMTVLYWEVKRVLSILDKSVLWQPV